MQTAVAFAIMVLVEIAIIFLLFSGPLRLPNMVKSDVAIPGSGKKPAYGYDIGVQKTLLLWFSGGFPWWPPSNAGGNSHTAAMESCGYPLEKRSPRIGQQDVSSGLLVSFSKNATLISNGSRPRESPGKSVLCRLVCLTQDV